MGRKPGEVRRPWTAEEEATLRALAGKVPLREIAARLGRATPSVQSQASEAGVSLKVRRP